jgi:HK97 family phage major capsid protein
MNSLVTLSNELLADSAMDVVSILTEQLSYGTNYEIDKQSLAGTGAPTSGLMKGIAGTSLVLGTGSANFSMLVGDNFSDAISKLSQGYLNGAKWVVGKTAKHYIRTLKDSNGAYIFQQPSAGRSATLWEYPVLESEHAPANAVSTVAALFGNLKNYVIGRRLGAMVLEADPYGLFTTYQTRFRMVTRWAFSIGNSAAFVTINTPSA